jgi:uncharacterized protein YkwD
MTAKNYFSHYAQGTNKSPADRMTDAGYQWVNWGENITVGWRTGLDAVDHWIHSHDGHREQILTTAFTETGVGCEEKSGTTYGTYATQKFGLTRTSPQRGAAGELTVASPN